jgi:hypothetical protein
VRRAGLARRLAKLERRADVRLGEAATPPWKALLAGCGAALYAVWNISDTAGFPGPWRPPAAHSDEEIDAAVAWYLAQDEPVCEPPGRPLDEQRARHADRQSCLAVAYLAVHGALPRADARQPCVVYLPGQDAYWRDRLQVPLGQIGEDPGPGECETCYAAPRGALEEALTALRTARP